MERGRFWRHWSVLPLAIALVGTTCTKTVFVVRDNPPVSPSLTVIPVAARGSDLDAAYEMTELLVGCGVRVIERPRMIAGRSEYELSLIHI